jgi:hypothetical protein
MQAPPWTKPNGPWTPTHASMGSQFLGPAAVVPPPVVVTVAVAAPRSVLGEQLRSEAGRRYRGCIRDTRTNTHRAQSQSG